MSQNNGGIRVPETCLVLLMGASGSGKSTFAKKYFKTTEVISSDYCRGLVSDDENSLAATGDAFELAHFIVGKRLKNGLLTVVDATNVQEESRKSWVVLARQYHVLPVAIVLNLPEQVCLSRNELREDRQLRKQVIIQQIVGLKRSVRRLKGEGFRYIYELNKPEEVEAITGIVRDPLYNNKRSEKGPFDIIGDVHGCFDELILLFNELGYREQDGLWQHPEGRKPVFVGDLVDRGPKSPEVLKLVMHMVEARAAWCVPGNHDMKLLKWLNGRDVQIKHGLQQTIDQLAPETPAFREEVKKFLDGLISHYVFDEGKLVVAHAGLKEEMQGRGSGAVREFCLYGETSGETDEFGLPVRYNWAADYRGKALVVYGHTPVPDAQWLNGTIDIDTGCVFGGRLTALRYPEKELISVPAAIEYSPPIRPFLNPPESTRSIQQEHDDLLDIADLSGKLILETKYSHNIGIREENTIAALEVMSRFAINPKWLIYLPPTMSPSETSHLEGYLEHPLEAFEYFRSVGVEKVICEEKHMGSRAVVMVGKDTLAISKSFGIEGEGIGVIYTRTGRPYFEDKATEQALLQRLNGALQAAGFFERWNTDWVCLDAELMPWNAKAQVLLERQYGSTGAAGTHALKEAVDALKHADVGMLLTKYAHRAEQVEKFVHAYRQYCWPVKHLEDYKLAPFHILATEGKVWIDETHEVHMKTIAGCYIQDKGILLATPYRIVDIHDETDLHEATEWWMNLTNRGGEGMVVKPMNFIHLHKNRLAQPAIKVRGREYLRIIYGPEYTTRENLDRLKKRGLGSKRALALKEFALGLESLDRFVRKEPLRKVHECVFGVLALESEPIDPRL